MCEDPGSIHSLCGFVPKPMISHLLAQELGVGSRSARSGFTTKPLHCLVSRVATRSLIAPKSVAGVQGILELPAPQYRSLHPTL
jgi:hypothetical protein